MNNNEKMLSALLSIAEGVPVEEKQLPLPQVDVTKLFTRDDMILARKHQKDTAAIAELVVRPRMAHINEVTGQENDEKYWAYALTFLLERNPDLGVRGTRWNW